MNGIKLEIMAAPFQNIYLYIVHPLQHLNITLTQHFLVSHYIIHIHQMVFGIDVSVSVEEDAK